MSSAAGPLEVGEASAADALDHALVGEELRDRVEVPPVDDPLVVVPHLLALLEHLLLLPSFPAACADTD
jgi:hypothetical protein